MCGCAKRRRDGGGTVWRVTFRDGSEPEEFASSTEARTVARRRGGTVVPVQKTR